MNLRSLLDADVGTLGAGLRRGLVWWGGELASLAPAALRRRPGAATRWRAELAAESGGVRLWRDGVLQEERGPGHAGGAARVVELVLPPGAALVQTLELPRVGGADLRAFLAMNMDRFTPFRAEAVYADAVVTGEPAGVGRQKVRLAVMARERADAALEALDALGLRVTRIGVGGVGGAGASEFDLMRAVRAERGGDPAGRRRTRLWLACAAALVANLAIAAWRDARDVDQVQALVDLQQPGVTLATRLRTTVAAERAERLGLLSARAAHDPLRILGAVTRALPRAAWVQKLEWNGRATRLVGFAPAGTDVLGTLRPPSFADARSLAADAPTPAAGGALPFDVVAAAPSALSARVVGR